MDSFSGLKEYPYSDKLVWIKDRAKSILKSIADYFDDHRDTVEMIIKVAVVVIGIMIAIKDTVTEAHISKKSMDKGHAHVRLYCFGLDLLNILKRIL